MLYRTNIIALVGGGSQPKFLPNKLVLWDDSQSKISIELRFSYYVKNVKLKKDKFFVVCETKIYIFSMSDFENTETLDTYDNPKGIIAVNGDIDNTVLAYPDIKEGQVKIKNFNELKSPLIKAHTSALGCLGMNYSGSLVATCSEKGTLIRIYNTSTGEIIQELRRGSEKAEIYCISFCPKNKYLCCTSSKPTVHIFLLKENEEDNEKNKKSL